MRELKNVQPKGAGAGGSSNRAIPRVSVINHVATVFFTDPTYAKLKTKGMTNLAFKFVEHLGRLGIKMVKPDLGYKGAVIRNYKQQAVHVHCPNDQEPRLLCDLEGPQEVEEEWVDANTLIYWLPDTFHFEQTRRRRTAA